MPNRVDRREFLTSMAVGAAVVGAGSTVGRASAQGTSPYPEWIAPSTKPPKRGGSLARASAWDPPVIDPRHTQSVGTFQFAGLVHNRLDVQAAQGRQVAERGPAQRARADLRRRQVLL